MAGSRLGEHPKNWDPLFISVTVEASNLKYGIQVGLGVGEQLTKKQLLGPKLAGVRARGASKKIGTPHFFVIFAVLDVSFAVNSSAVFRFIYI